MHKLTRFVRFSINPFLKKDQAGANSFCSNPCGEGLALFFELGVSLAGEVEPSTGFVVNVTEIDKKVRENVVPIFGSRIRQSFAAQKHLEIADLVDLMKSSFEALKGQFGNSIIADLTLKLNPYRKLSADCEDWKMIYFSEKFEFAAMHKLWNDNFSEQKNFEIFGKCANKTGHGHNYVIEITAKFPPDAKFNVGRFQQTIDSDLVNLVDHKNLNADVAGFDKTIPTIENIAVFAWNKLADKLTDAKLHSVTVWETDKTSCTYYG